MKTSERTARNGLRSWIGVTYLQNAPSAKTLRGEDEKGRSTRSREISGLLEAAEDLHCDDLTIVTHDEAEDLVVRGHRIAVVPVWKYLLKA